MEVFHAIIVSSPSRVENKKISSDFGPIGISITRSLSVYQSYHYLSNNYKYQALSILEADTV